MAMFFVGFGSGLLVGAVVSVGIVMRIASWGRETRLMELQEHVREESAEASWASTGHDWH